MRTEVVGEYTITAWAENLAQGWQGMASLHPGLSHLWSGGPNNDSLVVDGMHASEQEAVDSALSQALEELANALSGSK